MKVRRTCEHIVHFVQPVVKCVIRAPHYKKKLTLFKSVLFLRGITVQGVLNYKQHCKTLVLMFWVF